MSVNTKASDHDRLSSLHAALSEEFARQTARFKELRKAHLTVDPGEAHNQAALLAATRHSLEQITGALRRLAEGSYGRCENCGIPIPLLRLELLPHTPFCMPCQQHNG
ncbi:TraR/DksA family transcriptional regulator [Krasilnikovia sp. M28-CT-15]|uniref:TraR/DksA family transcriptional regulator n=1 Tax=Krasilnikovia sp. M28-CT-15 TaxID=3373540 RepID=UPI00387606B3